MRTPKDATARWQATFADAPDLSALREAIHNRGKESPCRRGLRSVCWKAFLVFENLDRSTWATTADESRSAYSSLRDHFLGLLQNPEKDLSIDPLTDVEDSPWNTLREDELLRAEILQDVERCMPEYQFFREPATKNALLDILFIYCKLNADIGYRQGMHELLAPIFWTVSQDAIDRQDLLGDSDDELMCSVLDSLFIEHDAFTLFCIIMQTAKSFYDVGSSSQASTTSTSTDSPIIARSQRIYNGYLRRTDRELMNHLKSIDILPQIFILRWIRLLFGREFSFEDVLGLWDVLFAEDPTFKLVDLICVAMLLRIRWQLLDSDYTSALTLLLRYPTPPPEHSPMSFVEDAIYLRSHLSSEGGSHLIVQYTGKSPAIEERKTRSLHTPQGSLDQGQRSPFRSPTRIIQESGGIETMLQEAAKGVYKRSERLGLNQALRGAVQQLQAVNHSPRKYISAARRSIDGINTTGSETDGLQQRIESLESRNKALGKLVLASMEDLNEQVCALQEEKHSYFADNLSLTVAKLQFVHIYLDNPTLPLVDETIEQETPSRPQHPRPPAIAPAIEDEETIAWSPVEHVDRRGRSPASESKTIPKVRGPPLATSNLVRESPTRKYIPRRRPPSTHGSTPSAKAPVPASPTSEAKVSSSAPSTRSPLHASRSSLAQSSFSWMLGSNNTDNDNRDFATASPFPPEQERQAVKDKKARGKASFLFGDSKDDSVSVLGKVGDRGEDYEDDDGFTLGTLRGVGKDT